MTTDLRAIRSAAPWQQPRPYIRYRPSSTSAATGYVWPAEWEVYIPPTKPEHFENGDVLNGAVLGPWGESYWPTWEEARDFLCLCADEVRAAFE